MRSNAAKALGIKRKTGGGSPLPAGYTYYVDPITGSDSNPGTRFFPFATLDPVETAFAAATVNKTAYATGETYTTSILYVPFANAGVTCSITFGANAVLQGDGVTDYSGFAAGGLASTLRIIGPGTLMTIQGFTVGAGNGVAQFDSARVEVYNAIITGNVDGVSMHGAGSIYAENCLIYGNSKGNVQNVGTGSTVGCGLVNCIVGSVSDVTTNPGVYNGVPGASNNVPFTATNCDFIPGGTITGSTNPNASQLGFSGTTLLTNCRLGTLTKSVFLTSTPVSGRIKVVNSFVNMMLDGDRGAEFGTDGVEADGCFGPGITFRHRSGGQGIRAYNCAFKGGATAASAWTNWTGNDRGIMVAGVTTASQYIFKNCIIEDCVNTAFGSDSNATAATALAAAGLSITYCSFFGNFANIDADIVTASGASVSTGNITTDPLTGAGGSTSRSAWGYGPGSPCIGAGSGGGNIGFAA